MSDRVETVAAEDAPTNTQNEEAVTSAQATPEELATTTQTDSQAAPEAEVTANEDEPLLEGPVGEVVDDTSDALSAEADIANESIVEEATVANPNREAPDDTEVGNAQAIAESATATTADAPEGDSASEDESASEGDDTSEGGKANVRILSVGQEVTGTVKRIADFGAFVDIGVGRDGLIHISELSVRRVGKVTDVLAEGQEVTAWIKKLDRDRNRISLTLIDPNTKTIRDLNKDDLVQGTVTRILPYGAFVDIGIGRDALLHVREMGVGYVAKPEDVVKVGDSIEARIIELSRRRGRVDLSLKGLRDEPEPTPAPQPEFAQPQQQSSGSRRRQEPEPEVQDEQDFEDLEVLSPMELAFKRAMEAEGMELNLGRKKQNKRNRGERNRSLQDEIVSRTLSSGRK